MSAQQEYTYSNPVRLLFISCREYTTLASRRLDEPLSSKQKIAYWVHHFACMVCRRFNRQIRLIERAAQRLSGESLSSAKESGARDEFLSKLEEKVKGESCD